MIDFELAKQLKEAGFPQTQWTFRWCVEVLSGDSYEHMLTHLDAFGVFSDEQVAHNKSLVPQCVAPTLSELIEACGEEFHQLRQYQGPRVWQAKSSIMHGAKAPAESDLCSTPEEAVAKLWLALLAHTK